MDNPVFWVILILVLLGITAIYVDGRDEVIEKKLSKKIEELQNQIDDLRDSQNEA